MTIGNRILLAQHRASQDMIEAFRALPVANVSDCMARVFAAGPELRPMHRSGTLAGSALTVRSRPGDNLFLHKAIDMAEPGDVIVVDAGGDLTNSLMGELMLAHAIRRGIAGFVLNGSIRDIDEIYNENLPVYAAGVTHRGPYKNGPGEINVTISVGGMVVSPGDLVLGDNDGVLSVPYNEMDSVLEAAREKKAREEKQMAAILNGTIDRSWVDAALRESGCEFPDS
ncbi:RraA family protein [Thalassorhabdomicrobium marinisediminis]|uniref:Putative 4-hydroxy-4-methyl-2-oxoglutarate aldolase n=1 Tax=Thalassorhabdomicrobium marinisediminis TaxID=2170577 RepID=A0A2T7FZD4_9RHOB|nr:RraA family protein [Thalassorhabdomicrobium marinisediminis]PVA07522.1 methyltransferase [Thalassorhabdomicrobium marinisediminis]